MRYQNKFLQEQLDLLKSKRLDPTIEWQDVNDFRVKSLNVVEALDTTRKGSKILNEYLDAGWNITPPDTGEEEVNTLSEYDDQLQNLRKERIKLQSEKIELNRNLRELARDEIIIENIRKAILKLPSFDIPEPIKVQHSIKSYLLCLSDAHFGVSWSIPDFYGVVLNEYSPEIFKTRMLELFSQLVTIIKKEEIKELTIFELGDGINGLLRLNSQLMQTRYGVVESSILYAEYLATWLDSLSHYVKIKLSMVKRSNHNQLRVCNAPKNAFPDEDMSHVINIFLKERLKDNPNIKILDNPTGMCYAQMSTYVCVGIHGESKSMQKTINELSRAYQHPIDYIFAGHKHHSKSEEVGINSEVVNVRSMCGVDPYGLSLNKSSDPGASLFVFEQGKGKIIDYHFIF